MRNIYIILIGLSLFHIYNPSNAQSIYGGAANAQPGSVDSTFGINGSNLQPSNYEGSYGIALQKDGKILSVLEMGNLIRFNTDGTLDKTFGINGRDTIDLGSAYRLTSATDVAVQENGKIIVTGDNYPVGSAAYQNQFLMRFNDDGTVDSSFGDNGQVITPFTSSYPFSALRNGKLLIQPDRKILVSAVFRTDVTAFADDIVVSRYLEDGSLDVSFGNQGIKQIDIANDFVGTIDLQKNGKIIIGGTLSYFFGKPDRFLLIRLLTDGNIDSTFGSGGTVYTAINNNNAGCIAVKVLPDDAIIAAGFANYVLLYSDICLVKYTRDGIKDSSFGDKGIVITKLANGHAEAFNIALQQNGKMVICGDFVEKKISKSLLVRYNPQGSLDSSFGDNGLSIQDYDAFLGYNSFSSAYDLAIQKDGKIVTTGVARDSAYYYTSDVAVSRYIGDPIKPSLITRIKRWIINHILHFQDPNAENTSYYVIEKSNGNGTFTTVAKIQNTNNKSEYSYVLPSTTNNEASAEYHVRAVHNDGSVAYSDVISETDDNSSAFSISPNPVKNLLHISGFDAMQNYQVRIMNVNGNVLLRASIKNSSSYALNVSQLKQGTYYLRIDDGLNNRSYSFLKE